MARVLPKGGVHLADPIGCCFVCVIYISNDSAGRNDPKLLNRSGNCNTVRACPFTRCLQFDINLNTYTINTWKQPSWNQSNPNWFILFIGSDWQSIVRRPPHPHWQKAVRTKRRAGNLYDKQTLLAESMPADTTRQCLPPPLFFMRCQVMAVAIAKMASPMDCHVGRSDMKYVI